MSTSTAWDHYVTNHVAATSDHLWAWREIFSVVFGQSSEYLMATRDGRVAGVLPLVLFRSRLFGKFAVSVPFLNYGGVLADDEVVANALVDRATMVARSFGASHVELRHAARQFAHLPMRQHKIGLTMSLPSTADALWQQVDRKIRNQVRKAQKEGLSVEEGAAELVDDFYEVFSHNMRDLGTPVYSKGLFAETLARFPAQARVLVVRRGGQPLAVGFSMKFRGTVLVPWASSLREFRNLCPNMLLYWGLLESAIAAGASQFDFGRSSPGGGTHQFKLQWGARESPLHWEYVPLNGQAPPDQGPSNPKFAAAIATWKKLPLWVANACGPYLAKQLP